MGFSELINLLKQQNESDKGFLIHLNTGDLEEKSCRNTGIEFADLYFTNCTMIRNGTILVFENINRKPVQHKEDGTPLYTIDSNSSMYIDITQIEAIEMVQDNLDWFLMPTKQVVHLYVSALLLPILWHSFLASFILLMICVCSSIGVTSAYRSLIS